jgi:C_GCAxxG_C_C family probable redox protein
MDRGVPPRALELFNGGLYCSESVLLAMAEARGVQSELVPRIATALGAGVGRTGGMCGAVSGALLGIGLVAGREAADQSVEPAFALVQSLIRAFEARHGSTSCPDLIGCDLGTKEGQRIYVEEHRGERCRQFVEDAARMAEEVIAQAP